MDIDKLTIQDNFGRQHDKRVKLTESQRDEILSSDKSIHALAKEFNVSRRLIQFIRDPAKLAANKLARDARGGSAHYYDKDKHCEYMRDHRAHKRKLIDCGKLQEI